MGVVQEVAGGQGAELVDQGPRQAGLLHGGQRLSRRQMRRAAEAVNATIEAVLRLELEDLGEQRQGVLLTGALKASHQLDGQRRQLEVGA